MSPAQEVLRELLRDEAQLQEEPDGAPAKALAEASGIMDGEVVEPPRGVESALKDEGVEMRVEPKRVAEGQDAHLEGMVGELIEFARMETGQWWMTHQEVNARALLTDLARRFSEDALILKRDFGWSIDIPEEATVRMDAGLFTRAR
jgi:signal transduction histidine kinase